ncbi:677aaf9a-d906-4ac9-abca-dcbebbde0d4b-CDS [Sclerotinia trifoliorum]|uniref:677aaf9a-d906-4ac9-abca-dcbebbde0d4b-CDS n=1 Tax=Sclerotinia trifoliorum TaxID=28548 RepID=A0A8H2VPE6_9HELO|nr:677aaf9a-d906-4ac9-abca-dcbebbde0d4b-CDS [Sclerotinia trifoliorum]
MFSYLRPHRRTSTPSSPKSEVPSFEPPARSADHGHPPRLQDVKYEDEPSPISPSPHLPPIARVSSVGYGNTLENLSFNGKITTYGHDSSRQSWVDTKLNNARKRSSENGTSQKSPLYTSNQSPDSAGNAGPVSTRNTGFDHSKSQSNAVYDASTKKHVGPTTPDLDIKPTGRRPTGARIPSPPLEAPPPQSSKGRLKMLNPMALLARRRTSQAITQLTPESLITSFSSKESFDPRIKGTVVHDFSAPRGPRRNASHNDASVSDATRSFQRSPYADSTTSEKAGNHTPVFTENFEEEQYPAAGPHVRKTNDLSDLTAPKPAYAREVQRQADQGSAPKVTDELQTGDLKRLSAQKSTSDVASGVPLKDETPVQIESKRISVGPASTPPKAHPSSRKGGRARNVSDASAKDALKHMKSTSSRFSFDMIGAAEQERLLEDRHRQKAMEKKNDPDNNDDQQIYDEDDDFNYDDMMDDDGLEERIPGVNADYDEDDAFEGFDGGYEEDVPGINTISLEEIQETEEQQDMEQATPVEDEAQPGLLDKNVAGFTFQPHVSSPMSPYTPGAATTPRDSDGQVIGFSMTKYSPFLPSEPPNSVFTPISPDGNIYPPDKQLTGEQSTSEVNHQGLGILTQNLHESREEVVQQQSSKSTSFPPISGLDDDDLYFDDGMIGLEGEADQGGNAGAFDESVFDNNDTDQYGRPIKDQFMARQTSNAVSTKAAGILEEIKEDTLSPLSPTVNRPVGGLAPQPSFSENRPSDAPPAQTITQSLTQDKLAEYQASLAAAAFSAAASGKFRRDSTQSIFHIDSDREENQPGLVTDSGHTSSQYEHLSSSYDDFDYDDALEDDEFIAAANAEALANDQDGFYGQEFGFYSHPAASSAEYINGGYFGPRGMDGMIRSQSGRIASREPNLTPITERSEYSNRNSFMSISHLHAPSGGSPMISPGLAQLMIAEDYQRASDMSLEALLKLRSRAWGGSQASVKSLGSNGNGNGSPKSVEGSGSPVAGGPLVQPPWGHRRKSSAFNLVSEEAEKEIEDTGNLITNQSSLELEEKQVPARDLSSGNEHEGDVEKFRRPSYTKQHKSNASAESISYSKEDDPVQGERWVLERRRTADSGEMGVLGRQVMNGGAI